MKRSLIAFIALMLTLTVWTSCHAKERYARDQVILELDPGIAQMPVGDISAAPDKIAISSSSIKSLNAKFKVKKIEKLFREVKEKPSSSMMADKKAAKIPDLSNFYIVNMPEDVDVKEAAEHYKKDPAVRSVSLNYNKELFLYPNDPDFKNLPSYFNQWGLYKIKAQDAWNLTTGSENVVVAVIDTGVNYNHEDLQGKIISGYNFTNFTTDTSDGLGHGSHVAGIIAASTNNSKGIAGITWNSKIMPLKMFDDSGLGFTISSARALIFAADNGAKVINMSYGGLERTPYEENAVNYAYARGCVMVAAAGNLANGTPHYPAAYEHVIAVAATDVSDRKADYSSFGPWVDICAPGGDTSDDPKSRILSTYNKNNYVWMMGTSMATPHVSGVAALLRSIKPELTPDQIEKQLKDTADDIYQDNPKYEGYLGAGRINAFRALNYNTTFSSIKNGSSAYGIVPITGTATHDLFDFYTIKWAPGTDPAENAYVSDGIALSNDGKQPVVDGLLGTWYAKDKFGTYTLKLSINDWSTLESTIVIKLGNYETFGQAESGPNPFNPAIGETCKIRYVLSGDMDITVYIFDINATIIWSKTYPSGFKGGLNGVNVIEWDGTSKFGGIAANGVYVFQLTSSGKQIAKGKIIVLK